MKASWKREIWRERRYHWNSTPLAPWSIDAGRSQTKRWDTQWRDWRCTDFTTNCAQEMPSIELMKCARINCVIWNATCITFHSARHWPNVKIKWIHWTCHRHYKNMNLVESASKSSLLLHDNSRNLFNHSSEVHQLHAKILHLCDSEQLLSLSSVKQLVISDVGPQFKYFFYHRFDCLFCFVFLFYLMMAMYCSWGQRPSPSVDGWGMVLDDYDGQMVSGKKCGLNFLTFILQQRENPGKNLN